MVWATTVFMMSELVLLLAALCLSIFDNFLMEYYSSELIPFVAIDIEREIKTLRIFALN